jgi:hypothetical protein
LSALFVLDNLQVSGTVNYKVYNNWRQIASLPWTPLCEILKSSNPLIQAALQNGKYFLPSFPYECPIKPGRYYEYNLTVPDINQWKGDEDDPYFKTVMNFPNGMLRFRAYFKTPKDPNAGFGQTYYEIKRRLNDAKF